MKVCDSYFYKIMLNMTYYDCCQNQILKGITRIIFNKNILKSMSIQIFAHTCTTLFLLYDVVDYQSQLIAFTSVGIHFQHGMTGYNAVIGLKFLSNILLKLARR